MKLKNVQILLMFILAAAFIPSAHAYTNLTGCGTITEADQNYQVTAATMSSASGPCLTINGSGTHTLSITCTAGVGATKIETTDSSAAAVQINSGAYNVYFSGCGFKGPTYAMTITGATGVDIASAPSVYGIIKSSGSDHTKIESCTITAPGAIAITGDTYTTIQYNTITWDTSFTQAPIIVDSNNSTTPTANLIIYGNIIDGGWNQGTGSTLGADDGAYIAGGCSNCQVNANTIKNVYDSGIEFAGPVSGTQVYSNIISGCCSVSSGAAISGFYGFGMSGTNIAYNIFCNGTWVSGSSCTATNNGGHNSSFLSFQNLYNLLWNGQAATFSNNTITSNAVYTPNSVANSLYAGIAGVGTTKWTGGKPLQINMTAGNNSGGYNYTTANTFSNNHFDYNQASGDTLTFVPFSPTSPAFTVSVSGNHCGVATSPLSCAALP